MSEFLGGDIDSMEAMRKALLTKADELKGLAKNLQAKGSGVKWFGNDATQFKSHDLGAVKSSLGAAEQKLRDGADKLRANFSAQQATSQN